MLRTLCIACRHGHHERHVEVIHKPPPGMMGGASCYCTGDCAKPAESHRRPCPLCSGAGCSDCDGTGEKVTTMLDAGDGIIARIHGSAPLSPKAEEALREVMRAAAKELEADDV